MISTDSANKHWIRGQALEQFNVSKVFVEHKRMTANIDTVTDLTKAVGLAQWGPKRRRPGGDEEV